MEDPLTRTSPNRFRVTVADIFWFEADTFGDAMSETRRWSAIAAPVRVEDCAVRILGQVSAVAFAAE